MSLRFTDEYYPDLAELTDEQLAAARQEVVQELQPYLPDVDLSPATPTGDMVVAPLAAARAAANEANNRLMSDLDLANVADGLIYSCDFVRAYLGNFAVYDVDNLRAFGLIRLTFTSGAARTIPRTIRFRFNTDDDWSLRVVNPDATEISLLAAGSSHDGSTDTYVLAQTSSTTWSVDLPLTGVLTSPVLRYSAATVNELPAGLTGAQAACAFMSGLPTASLRDLARMARKAAFSLTAGSRASVKSMIYRNWPEAAMVSPIVPSDPEMQRMVEGTAMALLQPALDVYTRSARDMQRETQNIRLEYVVLEGETTGVFRGRLPLLHRASRIVSLTWSGVSSVTNLGSFTVFTRTERDDLSGCLHCGTRFETLYVEFVPVLDDNDTPLIPLTDIVIDEVTRQFAVFTVIYDADPMLESVSDLLESVEYRPVGVDVLVKSGPLILLDALTVYYSRKSGTKMTLGVAREKIVEYLRTAGYPDVFRQTELHDIMRYAGAERVTRITCAGHIMVSAATRLMRATLADPDDADLAGDWATESDALNIPEVTAIEDMAPFEIIDGEISVGGPPDAWAATIRTVRYAVDPENVSFVEV